MTTCEATKCEARLHQAKLKEARRRDDAPRIRRTWRLERSRQVLSAWLAASVAGTLTLMSAHPAEAQRRQPVPLVSPPTQFIACPQRGQPLVRVPELVSQGGILHGTIELRDAAMRMDLNLGADKCVPQFVRNFRGVDAVLPGYAGAIPPEYPGYVSPPPANPTYRDPLPGPTLRARVGDVVQLTFLNHIDLGDFGDSIDRGERGQGCDESSRPYPGPPTGPHDEFPDCFHGSSTGNIHFHGTHTNPGTTGDNVLVEVRPSTFRGGRPIVTEGSVRAPFDEFFAVCNIRLRNDPLSQWPTSWKDLPPAWTRAQEDLLKAYDSEPAIANKLWPVDEAQLKAGAWPQYYIGATPYCFRLPRYVAPPAAAPADHAAHAAARTVVTPDAGRVLQMGQAPGTHWYHAHKHGSTAIDVANGMTGAFIIEGPYDDALEPVLRRRLRSATLDAGAAGAGDQPVGCQPPTVRRRQRAHAIFGQRPAPADADHAARPGAALAHRQHVVAQRRVLPRPARPAPNDRRSFAGSRSPRTACSSPRSIIRPTRTARS